MAVGAPQISPNKELFPDSGVRLHAAAVVCRMWKISQSRREPFVYNEVFHQASAAEHMLGPKEATVLQAPDFR